MSITITNSAGGYVINELRNPTIFFVRGNRYVINVNAPGHPFFIQTVSGPYSSGNVYNTGVTNNGTDNGTIVVDVALNAPSLFYACQYHGSMVGSISVSDPVLCFSEDAKILCYRNEEVYVCIKDIRKGELVKTCASGYVKVDMIGHSKLHHLVQNDYKNQLFRLTPANFPSLLEDLILTGCHSILVETLTDVQIEKTKELLGKIYITDNYYRLMTGIAENSELVEEGEYPIWHFALENEDYYKNYGVYANGLLVESCSKRMMKDFGMTLL